ncbi:hypothetical protein D9M72_419540 [compost metagenome]
MGGSRTLMIKTTNSYEQVYGPRKVSKGKGARPARRITLWVTTFILWTGRSPEVQHPCLLISERG